MSLLSEHETVYTPAYAKKLTQDLQKLVKTLRKDLRERCDEIAEVNAPLREAWQKASEAQRTVSPFETWREEYLDQVAVNWVLACVFVRFLEDTDLVADVRLAGEGDRLERAFEEHERYFRQFPTHTDREYLQWVFREAAKLPGMKQLLGDGNPLWRVGVSGDGAKALLVFFQDRDAASGALMRTFGFSDTRFLGDLYQDLSEDARKRYALLQTPEFVEEFILDRTLEPAIGEFGLDGIKMIDPTCGSGHFLLGGFRRIYQKLLERKPGSLRPDIAQQALHCVFGVDLNPFAVEIARFRLLVEALRICGIDRLKDAPAFNMHLAAGDSLLHGRHEERGGQQIITGRSWMPDDFARGDFAEASEILTQRYDAVVGNPPYIVDKDRAHNEFVRGLYDSCYQKFSLGVPFTERFFELARQGEHAGFVGMITTNSFMKREFGKKLIEDFIPKIDLTHVIDTSGAYIPGHGTPTVILFGRNRPKSDATLRAVLGIRGEPSTPEDASKGVVWTSIARAIDQPGFQSEFVSSADVSRAAFEKHPWSIGGGGASDLKETIEAAGQRKLAELVESVGITSFTLEDDVYLLPQEAAWRKGLPDGHLREMVIGEKIRDWATDGCDLAVFPYDERLVILPQLPATLAAYLWRYRTNLSHNVMFGGKTKVEAGLRWYEYGRLTASKLRTPLSIAFAFVSTHNHFVLDRGGKVFNRSAPVIKLPPDKAEDDHLALLGLLNSSVACFWLKQVCSGKHKGDGGEAHADPAYQRFEFDGTKLQRFPMARPGDGLDYSKKLDSLSRQMVGLCPAAVLSRYGPDQQALLDARTGRQYLQRERIFLQEELDWLCYELYGIIEKAPLVAPSDIVPIDFGQRAFEIRMAREEEDPTWFERHGAKPLIDMQSQWPLAYKQIVQQRLDLIASNSNIALLEKPEHKRRWQTADWDEELQQALADWMLDRLEKSLQGSAEALNTTAALTECVRHDEEFKRAAALYAGKEDVELAPLLAGLVSRESVPFLPALRYSESGLQKRAQWEQTWDLQRREDRGDNVGKIPVPPKYASADFQSTDCWRLRGKLDVPKERFISYPYCETEGDDSLVIGWAGWNHAQQAKALATYFMRAKDTEGWSKERLTPLLAGLYELLPWLLQWHNDIDPDTGERLGSYYEGFAEDHRRALGLTPDDLRNWRPPARAKGKRRNLSKKALKPL